MTTKLVVHTKQYLLCLQNTLKIKRKMKTIPDLITDIKWYYKRAIDRPLSWMEAVGSWMSCYAWQKRWGNREKGTGYKRGK